MMKTLNENYKDRVLKMLDGQKFMHHIKFNLDKIEVGRTEGHMALEDIHKQQYGFVHGGVVATVADIVAGFAACTLVPADHHVVTGEIKVSYFNPGVGDGLYAVGWVLKQGRKINFCESEVWAEKNGDKVLLAKASASMVTVFPEDIQR